MTQGTENKSTIEEKFALVKGRPYASAVDEQSYDMEGILTADSKNSAIVHADFAEKNGLAVGDKIGVEINGGKSISLTITGLYRAGNERKQDEDTLAVHRKAGLWEEMSTRKPRREAIF